ncbi:MAG: hypothetical protein K0S25_1781 [Bacillus sp. (in: firmicutes)]|jgi:8-oxo-dGTP diphosphatase|uniref:NUDIX hydrolase n=1 Tax=Bacillus sp. 1NLA3E TaxID=666686 RepID=UPI000247EE5E|nr:8-oxo-dGTP diphosphatase [Bacillus sp. 1NLA3E]AGK55608.1 Mutator mutT protein (7,8-dihydro-8-oxoguanine-triphosphatase) [Bacillus sp. 1NLA3E]MDF2904143.1 hypothetical protein [Bacillus sp. (in: firmicutes)]
MQRVTNCVLLRENKVLLLQKPRRGWWVAPGGKMERGESVKDACIREFREETGIYLKDPKIKGIFTFIMVDPDDGDKVLSEWMMFTFIAKDAEGPTLQESEEGKLTWHEVEQINSLPMAEGDHHIIEYMVHGNGIIYGTFTYTPEFKLVAYRLDPS